MCELQIGSVLYKTVGFLKVESLKMVEITLHLF